MEKVNLFLVGAPKAGTSTLYDVFSKVADITTPKVKESNFFFYGDINSYTIRKINNLDDYHATYFFNLSRYYLDATPSYLKSKRTCDAIHDYNPDAKIIIVLREGVSRAFSNWKMDFNEGYTKDSFRTLFDCDFSLDVERVQFDYYKASLYSASVNEYIAKFGKENVLVLLFDELYNDKASFYSKISRFLDVEIREELYSLKTNPARVPKSNFIHNIYKNKFLRKYLGMVLPSSFKAKCRKIVFSDVKKDTTILDANELAYYKKFFIDDVEKLEKDLGIDLSGWK